MAKSVMPRTRLKAPAGNAAVSARRFNFHEACKAPMTGIARRLGRFFHASSGRAVILPLDHGVGEGMLPGLKAVGALVGMLNGRDVQGVVLNKGPAKTHAAAIALSTGLIVQLSGGTKHALPSYGRAVVCTVGEALRLGADAVAMQINIGNDLEERMLTDFGVMADEAHQAGLPVMAIIAPRGGHIVNEEDPNLISHCVRLGSELGADMTGVPYGGDPSAFALAVESSDVPVLVTGGPGRGDHARFLTAMEEALACGAAGFCVGRNVFQSQEPAAALDQLIELAHAPDGSKGEPEEQTSGPHGETA